MRLLLDTATFLWYTSNSSRIPPATLNTIRDADEVFLSVVSFWEVTIKHGTGRLTLRQAPEVYVPQQRERHGFLSLGVDEEAVKRLPGLPSLHNDPFDRMLICQALKNALTLVTPDSLVRSYPVVTLWDGV